MFALIWWLLVLGATVQMGRAWGAIPALGALFVGWVMSVTLPLGGLLTAVGAVALGAQAEGTIQRRLTG